METIRNISNEVGKLSIPSSRIHTLLNLARETQIPHFKFKIFQFIPCFALIFVNVHYGGPWGLSSHLHRRRYSKVCFLFIG